MPSKEYLEQLTEAVALKKDDFIEESLAKLHVVDISLLMDEMSTDECKYILEILDKEIGAEILANLDEDDRIPFLKTFTSIEIASFIDYIESDDGADILQSLPVRIREEVLAYIKDPSKEKNIIDLLYYDEDCAGGLMAKEVVIANLEWDVEHCIEEIRSQGERVEKIHTVYVVDDENILLGRVSLKKIIISSNSTLIKDLLISDLESVETFRSEDEIADVMQRYNLEVIPVVNVRGQLLGRITIDDILDVITEKAEHDQQVMSGISGNVEDRDSVWTLTKARLPWLLVGMLGGLMGAKFIGLFEPQLVLIPAMAFFIPLITATGGNVGIQSSTIMVQALANSEPFKEGFWESLFKTLLVAILNGIVISSVVLGFNLMFFEGYKLPLVVSIALFAVVLIASLLGTITPVALTKMKINPALASGPFITTTNDLVGLGVYFSVARLLYQI